MSFNPLFAIRVAAAIGIAEPRIERVARLLMASGGTGDQKARVIAEEVEAAPSEGMSPERRRAAVVALIGARDRPGR